LFQTLLVVFLALPPPVFFFVLTLPLFPFVRAPVVFAFFLFLPAVSFGLVSPAVSSVLALPVFSSVLVPGIYPVLSFVLPLSSFYSFPALHCVFFLPLAQTVRRWLAHFHLVS